MFAPLILVVTALAVPYFLNHNFLLVGLALRRGFALVCHQRPERSFCIFGAPVAVCARCLGIYLGAAIGLLTRTSHSVAMRLLIAAAALNLLDALTELARLHGNWLSVRFGFGMALGATVGLVIAAGTEARSSVLPSAVSQAEACSCETSISGRWPEGQL